ncbi:S1 domain-containing protein [Novosphingobium lindaniclasticum]|uniref:translation initiation factor IF-1 n=1 Tax=Novosphingobium lindaniclasticum TaxID=1329895 RepID=UPI003899171E
MVLLDNEHKIIAYCGQDAQVCIRSMEGDRVHVEMTPCDLSKGRIAFRERAPEQAGEPPRRRSGFRR